MPLALVNPARIPYFAQHFGAPPPAGASGVKYVDVGCGGGIATEALAKLGYPMVGELSIPSPRCTWLYAHLLVLTCHLTAATSQASTRAKVQLSKRRSTPGRLDCPMSSIR